MCNNVHSTETVRKRKVKKGTFNIVRFGTTIVTMGAACKACLSFKTPSSENLIFNTLNMSVWC